ncbi:UNVERIFIED_CONTAM: hypothetical protein GTU68_043134 [Idotea baltica]|nr:hypothetical protein [Idotea baltica]
METLKEVGLKTTQPRLMILHLFEESDKRHLSPNDIYQILHDQNNNLSLGTIYRVLDQFEKSGLISCHRFSADQAVYELSDSEHHDHMIDTKSGKIIEFYDEIIEQRQREIAAEHNFDLQDHRLVLYGVFKEN